MQSLENLYIKSAKQNCARVQQFRYLKDDTYPFLFFTAWPYKPQIMNAISCFQDIFSNLDTKVIILFTDIPRLSIGHITECLVFEIGTLYIYVQGIIDYS